jgi:tRNA-splicing ligase RtcB (3'-phosphate/5'-hydroxy nucleic acid ligase)
MSRQHRKRRQQVEKKNERKRAARAAGGPAAEAPYKGRPVPLERVDDQRWRVPKTGGMHVDGIVYASQELLPDLREDQSLHQVANVATLPGIVGHSLAMPDIHWGYGFPIGGVAAFEPQGGVVSPGGVGYDINCGCRLMTSDLSLGDIKPRIESITQKLFDAIPSGVGSTRPEMVLGDDDLSDLMQRGLGWALDRGLATPEDVARCEENGRIAGAEPERVSKRARSRGRDQVGTLGSGNHFAELGVVDELYDEAAAEAFGLRLGQVTLMIHSGSRGLGHQVCEDSLSAMLEAARTYGIPLVDRQLCCAPIDSPEAKGYLGAMAAAANFAFVNRQVMARWARDLFKKELGSSLRTVYDVCHNIAKFEEHEVDGKAKKLLVHRKGATRALPQGHALLPDSYRPIGQPVVIPGDMGRYSFVLKGAPGSSATFGSACHGAGRLLSRGEAKRLHAPADVQRDLAKRGVVVIGASRATVVEEVPEAYKDVAQVVDVVHQGGLAEKVARIRPIGVVKG